MKRVGRVFSENHFKPSKILAFKKYDNKIMKMRL
jgi:hypothetical protein